jgi:outer membrane protein
MSKNELMPVLNLVVETSLHGLRGNYDVKGAYNDQFKPMHPNYTVGLMLDVPLGNRVAEARHRRRQIELRQMTDQLRVTVETVLLEVQVAVRELDTSYREMLSQYQAMLAYKTNLGFLEARRSVGLQSADQSRFLEQLLDAQKKLSESEQAFLQSYVAYNISHSNLDRATGLFLEARRISPQEEEDDKTKLPLMRLKQLDKPQPTYPEGLPQ